MNHYQSVATAAPRKTGIAFIALLALLLANEALSNRYIYPSTIWANGRVYGSCITTAINWGNNRIEEIEASRVQKIWDVNIGVTGSTMRTNDLDDLYDVLKRAVEIRRINREHDGDIRHNDNIMLVWSYNCAEAQSKANRINYSQFNWLPIVSGLLYVPAPSIKD